MTVNKRKKVTKYRAHRTHGGGHPKKRRGAGNRGGRGRAGRGKKGKGKKPSFEKLGQHGFTPRSQSQKIRVINLNDLDRLIQNKKLPVQEGLIDLASLGYQKLLGTGTFTQRLKIKINYFSKKAEEKIKASGSSLISVAPLKTKNKKEEKTTEE